MTLGVTLSGALAPFLAVGYVLAQIGGALLGAAFVRVSVYLLTHQLACLVSDLLFAPRIPSSTGWERTVHVCRCPALYSGRIFVPLCRELIISVF